MMRFVAGLGAVLLAVGACSLNPQPLPPDNGGDAGTNASLFGDGGTGGGGSSGTAGGGGSKNHLGADAGRDSGRPRPPFPDATAGDDGGGGGSEDGGFDTGGPEAGAVDAAGDAPLDAPSDGGSLDAGALGDAGTYEAAVD